MSSEGELAPPRLTFDVRILSQLPEPHASISFSGLPSHTTVAQLKTRIRDTVPTHPLPEHQRLIYRGHGLTREGDALESIFGKESQRQANPHILHLVVRDSQQQSAAAAQSLPTRQPDIMNPGQPAPMPALNAIRNAMTGGPTPTVPGPVHAPFEAGLPQAVTVTAGQPSHSNTPQAHGLASPPNTQPQPQPQPLNNVNPHLIDPSAIFQQHMRSHEQHLRHHHHHHQHHHQGMPPQIGETVGQGPRFSPGQINVLAAAQQHNRPNAEPNSWQQTTQQQSSRPQYSGSTAGTGDVTNGHQTSLQVGPANRTVVREHVGPDGQRWMERITINTTAHFGPRNLQIPMPSQDVPIPGLPRMPMPRSGTVSRSGSPAHPPQRNGGQVFHPVESMQRHQEDLDRLSSHLARHLHGDSTANLASLQDTLQHAQRELTGLVFSRNHAQRLINSSLPSGQVATHEPLSRDDISRLQVLSERFHRQSKEVDAQIEQLKRQIAQRSEQVQTTSVEDQTPNATHNSNPTRSATSMYMVMTPEGPHSVVFTPQGVWQGQHIAHNQTSTPLDPTTAASQRPSGQGSIPHEQETIIARLNREIEVANRAIADMNGQMADANNAVAVANGAVADLNRETGGVAPTAPPLNAQRQDLMNNLNNLREIARIRPMRRPQPPDQEHLEQLRVQAEAFLEQERQRVRAQDGLNGLNQAGDIFRIIGPIIRQMWLIVRVFAFVWFFAGGSSMQRMGLYCVAAGVYLLLQADILRPYRDMVRRHFEGLLGVPPEQGNETPQAQQQQEQQQQQRTEQNGPGAGSDRGHGQDTARRRRGEPTPEQTAARLLQERRDQDRGWLRDNLRSVERAVALFVASLYPGVGERHVAARERAVREADERQRREQTEGEAQATRGTTQSESAAEEQGQTLGAPADASHDMQTSCEQEKSMAEASIVDAQSAGEGSSSAVETSGGGTARQRTTEAAEAGDES